MPIPWTERGYTGHEHLDAVRLIHMNGRVQDPVWGRMLSPDPVYVGDMMSPQTLNPYSYVTNRPLSATDPTGFAADEIVVTVIRNRLFIPTFDEFYIAGIGGGGGGGGVGGGGDGADNGDAEIEEIFSITTPYVRYLTFFVPTLRLGYVVAQNFGQVQDRDVEQDFCGSVAGGPRFGYGGQTAIAVPFMVGGAFDASIEVNLRNLSVTFNTSSTFGINPAPGGFAFTAGPTGSFGPRTGTGMSAIAFAGAGAGVSLTLTSSESDVGVSGGRAGRKGVVVGAGLILGDTHHVSSTTLFAGIRCRNAN